MSMMCVTARQAVHSKTRRCGRKVEKSKASKGRSFFILSFSWHAFGSLHSPSPPLNYSTAAGWSSHDRIPAVSGSIPFSATLRQPHRSDLFLANSELLTANSCVAVSLPLTCHVSITAFRCVKRPYPSPPSLRPSTPQSHVLQGYQLAHKARRHLRTSWLSPPRVCRGCSERKTRAKQQRMRRECRRPCRTCSRLC